MTRTPRTLEQLRATAARLKADCEATERALSAVDARYQKAASEVVNRLLTLPTHAIPADAESFWAQHYRMYLYTSVWDGSEPLGYADWHRSTVGSVRLDP